MAEKQHGQRPAPIYLGGLASSFSAVFTNPMEAVKVRLQVDAELQSSAAARRRYQGALHAFRTIVRSDGPLALQQGLVPALYYNFFMNAVRLGLYEHFVHYFESPPLIYTDATNKAIWPTLVSSAASGALGALVASPFFLAKTRLQVYSRQIVDQHPKESPPHRAPGPTMLGMLAQLYRAGGVTSLWKGSGAAMCRVATGSCAQLTCYEASKRLFAGLQLEKYTLSLLASMLSSVAVVLSMSPLDVITTRIYNNPETYRSVPHASVLILRAEGLMGFYKGATAGFLRLGPHSILTLLFWELLKDAESYINR